MSFNRENITWQSADGTWSLGFYTCHEQFSAFEDDDYDPEWDVEYDMNSFEWVSTGHRSEEAAYATWDGPNPGGGCELSFSPEAAAQVERYDDMAARAYEASRSPGRTACYRGPTKTRTRKAVQAEHDALDAKIAAVQQLVAEYRRRGVNLVGGDMQEITARRDLLAAQLAKTAPTAKPGPVKKPAAGNPGNRTPAPSGRVPAGVPTGGQFAAQTHPEADLKL